LGLRTQSCNKGGNQRMALDQKVKLKKKIKN